MSGRGENGSSDEGYNPVDPELAEGLPELITDLSDSESEPDLETTSSSEPHKIYELPIDLEEELDILNDQFPDDVSLGSDVIPILPEEIDDLFSDPNDLNSSGLWDRWAASDEEEWLSRNQNQNSDIDSDENNNNNDIPADNTEASNNNGITEVDTEESADSSNNITNPVPVDTYEPSSSINNNRDTRTPTEFIRDLESESPMDLFPGDD